MSAVLPPFMKRVLYILLAALALALPASLLTQCDTSAHASTTIVRGPVASPAPSLTGYRYFRFTILKREGPDDLQNAVDELGFTLLGSVLGITPSVTWLFLPGDNTFGVDPNNANPGVAGKAYSFAGGGEPPYRYLEFDFGTAVAPDAFYWIGADVEARDPARWTMEGSNDGSTWSTLHDQSGADYTGPRNPSDSFSL